MTSELDQIKRWSKSPFVRGDWMYGLALWNGLDYPQDASIDFTLMSPPTQRPPSDRDRLVIKTPERDFLESSGVPWETVLSCARQLATKLGGVAVVSSNELIDQAKVWQLEEPIDAAYAAFWGIDRSGRNRQYVTAKQAGIEPPFEKMPCRSWDEVRNPNSEAVQELIELLKTPEPPKPAGIF